MCPPCPRCHPSACIHNNGWPLRTCSLGPNISPPCTGWVLGFFMTREVVCIRLPAVSLIPGRDMHPVSWLPASPRYSYVSSTWAHPHANLQEFCGLRFLLHTSPGLLLVLMKWALLTIAGPFPVRVCQFSPEGMPESSPVWVIQVFSRNRPASFPQPSQGIPRMETLTVPSNAQGPAQGWGP